MCSWWDNCNNKEPHNKEHNEFNRLWAQVRLQVEKTNGDEDEYDLWEAKFLGNLRMLKLKTTILPSEDPPDKAKNEECYAELD